MKTIRELLAWYEQQLTDLRPEQARGEAEFFLQALLRCPRSGLYLDPERRVSEDQERSFKFYGDKRREGVPVAYLLKKTFFWEEELAVGPGCLVPRPETEILVEAVIREIGGQQERKISFLDIGTGSGAIAIALLRHFPNAQAALLDISEEALRYAQENVQAYKVQARTEMICSDVFDFWKKENGKRKWDWIVSNPPYLSASDRVCMEPELHHEPLAALDGGTDGLDFYRKLVDQAPAFLHESGWMAVEVGKGQAEYVAQRMSQSGRFHSQEIFKDYLGIERVVMAQRK